MLLAHVLQKFIDKSVISYIEEILIYKQAFEQHRAQLTQVFQALTEVQPKVRIEKCHFTIHKVEFFTHQITANCIKSNIKNIGAVLPFSIPKNIKTV